MKALSLILAVVLLCFATACNSTNDGEITRAGEEPKENYVAEGDIITSKTDEIEVLGYEFTKDVMPPNVTGFYTHYAISDNDNVYMVIRLKVTNTAENDLLADKAASITIKYNDKYSYATTKTVLGKDKNTFDFPNITNIAPLTAREIYFMSEVPQEVQESENPISATIYTRAGKYEYKIR